MIAADPTDDKFFACAEGGQMDTIVASDKQHLLPLGSDAGIPIIRPHQFLEILAQTAAES